MATAAATATATATAKVTATATAMLKMDENVNIRLQRHVNRYLFCCLRLFSWHRFVNFSKYWVANDRERKR